MTAATKADQMIGLEDPQVQTRFNAALDEHGFVVVREAYAPDELAHLLHGIVQLEARGGKGDASFVFRGPHLWAIWNLYELMPGLMRLALAPRPFGLVAGYLGEPADFCRATIMKKTPGATVKVDWHQDTAVAVDREVGGAESRGLRDGVPHRRTADAVLDRMVIARINVEPQFADGGCLQVIPGSQRWGKLEPEEVKRRCAAETPLSCPTPAGSVLFYKPLLSHCSGPNTRAPDGFERRVIHNEFHAVSCAPDPAHPTVGWYPWKQRARVACDGVTFFA